MRIDNELKKMQSDVLKIVHDVYEDSPPVTVAFDSLASEMRGAMIELRRRWSKRFAELAKVWGLKFTQDATGSADRAFMSALRAAGISIRFQPTRAAKDVFAATLNEQVNLITSIPAECLTDVATLVNISVMKGGDIGGLKKELVEKFGVTRKRAALISRDQNNKATATITKVRQLELGITKARWLHSSGGRYPREEHVAFSHGRHHGNNKGPFYDVDKGAFLEGKWVWPGTEINCRCVSCAVIPGLED